MSRSEWLTYLATLLLTTILLVGLALLAIDLQAKEDPPTPAPFQALLDYQLGKIDEEIPDTIFLGDSSLGNAIDVDAWEQLTEKPAVSLALNGTFGYAGSYNLLRRVLSEETPENVIIMHTADMLTRDISHTGYELTEPEPSLLGRLSRYWRETMTFPRFLTATKKYFGIEDDVPKKGVVRSRQALTLENDYVRQREPLPPFKQAEKLLPEELKAEKLKYLEALAELCEEKHLNCLYVMGPLATAACERSTSYLKAAARMIRSAGIRLVVENPLCLAPDEVGDRVDHVKPVHKRAITRRYLSLLRPYLK